MKLLISKNTYQASNVFLSVSNGCKTFALTTVGGYVCVYGSAKLDAPKLENKNDET